MVFAKDEFRSTLRVLLDTSPRLISLYSRQLLQLVEAPIGGELFSFFRQGEPVNQDALFSMPPDLAASYLQKGMQEANFLFFFDNRPFRYIELPEKLREQFLEEYLPSLFWKAIGQIAGYSIWFVPFAILYGVITSPKLTLLQALLPGIMFAVFVVLLLDLFVLLGVFRRFRPFPFRKFPPIRSSTSLWVGFRSMAILGTAFFFVLPVCFINYCVEAFFLDYVILASLILSFSVAKADFIGRVSDKIVRSLQSHLQYLASVRSALLLEPQFKSEREEIDLHRSVVRDLIRSQSRPTRRRTWLTGAASAIAGLVGTLIRQFLFQNRSGIISEITGLTDQRNLLWFAAVSVAVAVMSTMVLNLHSRGKMNRMFTSNRSIEIVMEALAEKLTLCSHSA